MARISKIKLPNEQNLYDIGVSWENVINKPTTLSGYGIAVDNGFNRTVEKRLESLKGQNGISSHVGENGNWFIGDIDTEVAAAANNIIPIPNGEIDSYFQNDNNSENISPLSIAELDKLFI